MKRTTLQEKQEAMRSRGSKPSQRSGPKQAPVLDQALVKAQARYLAFVLMKTGMSDQKVAVTVAFRFNRKVTVEGIKKFRDEGFKLQ